MHDTHAQVVGEKVLAADLLHGWEVVDLLERTQPRQFTQQVAAIAPPDVPLGLRVAVLGLDEAEAALAQAFADHGVPTRGDVDSDATHALLAAWLVAGVGAFGISGDVSAAGA